MELIHTYSLVHDDLPCLDNDDERRGRPTVHIAYDEGTALLVGDALLTEAFALLARQPLPAETVVALIQELSTASGHLGMIGGQAADIGLNGPVETLETLKRLHRLKTGALLTVSATMGARVAQADPDQLCSPNGWGRPLGWRSNWQTMFSTQKKMQDQRVPPHTLNFWDRVARLTKRHDS